MIKMKTNTIDKAPLRKREFETYKRALALSLATSLMITWLNPKLAKILIRDTKEVAMAIFPNPVS